MGLTLHVFWVAAVLFLYPSWDFIDVTPLNFSKTSNFISHKLPKGQTKENMTGKNYLENYTLVSQGSLSNWKVEVRDIPQRSSLLHMKYWSTTLITISKYFLLNLQLKLTCRRHFSLKKCNISRIYRVTMYAREQSTHPFCSDGILCPVLDTVFKERCIISERLEDREATSVRDLKNPIYKGKLAGWKGFLQEQSKNNGLKVMLTWGFQRRGHCSP